MNAIELLKEARDELGAVQYYIPPADETVEMTPAITADVGACQKLAERIDAYLAAPRESATGEKWGPSTIDKIRQRNADGDFTLDYWRATELFEDYGRRVPRDEMYSAYSAGWCDGYKAKHVESDWIDEGFQEWAAKYGVKMEDAK